MLRLFPIWYEHHSLGTLMSSTLNRAADPVAKCLEELDLMRRQVEQSQAAALSADEELKYFVYAAGHDLQQPLRTIGAFAQLLQREYPNDERAKEFTGIIIDAAAEVNKLVTDLLSYSRTSVVPRPTPVKLNIPLQWALYNLAKAIKASGAVVVSHDLPEAVVDEQHMVTVFEQLISNSIKYCGSETPQVEIVGETGDECHTISVRDNGSGIEPEYHEKVFEPFKRLHSKEIPGSGLGLSICRKIVRAHKGKIWIESDGKTGSVVKFTMPV